MAKANRVPHRDVYARQWLDRLLAGQLYPEAKDLEDFVRICGDDEGLHHEFKPGADPSSGTGADPATVLRRYAAGFANSDGGFVVFGYYQKGRAFDGFRPPGGGKLVDWATRALQPLATYLAPPARIFTVARPGAPADPEVLLVAVRRAPAFVPVIVAGRPVFYVRMGDSTVELPSYNTIGAPDYLIADVLLGRRQRPVLVPSRPTMGLELQPKRELGASVTAHEAIVRINLENESLVYADVVTAGLVAWSLDTKQLPKPPKRQRSSGLSPLDMLAPRMPAMVEFDRIPPKELSRSLTPYVELKVPERNKDAPWTNAWTPVHAPAWRGVKDVDLAPFEATELEFGPFLWPVFQCTDGSAPPEDENARLQWAMRRGRLQTATALYVAARSGEPRWFSVVIRYGEDALPQEAAEMKKPSPRALLELETCDGERVRVSVDVDRGD